MLMNELEKKLLKKNSNNFIYKNQFNIGHYL